MGSEVSQLLWSCCLQKGEERAREQSETQRQGGRRGDAGKTSLSLLGQGENRGFHLTKVVKEMRFR